jgi:hypothetical protein
MSERKVGLGLFWMMDGRYCEEECCFLGGDGWILLVCCFLGVICGLGLVWLKKSER